jgi:hypothetical protein
MARLRRTNLACAIQATEESAPEDKCERSGMDSGRAFYQARLVQSVKVNNSPALIMQQKLILFLSGRRPYRSHTIFSRYQ